MEIGVAKQMGGALVVGLALSCLAACESGESRAGRPDVIVYLVDTLRPDHLQVYGYGRNTAPHLDRLATDGVVFERAYTPATWTKPACASLLTGLAPQEHGAVSLRNKLRSEVTLLSERLKEVGYRTAAFVNNVNVTELWGFDQGFDHFDDVKERTGSSDAEPLVSSALGWLRGQGKEPVFLYVHTIDPHGAYDPPGPYRSRWGQGGGGPAINPLELSDANSEAELERTLDLYDGEITYNDHHFGRLLDCLGELGRYDDAFVFYLSDHGEEFLEHGRGGHAHTLYEELTRVPLVVKFPANARAGSRVSRAASLLDVVPTIIGAVDRPIPAELLGVDLGELAGGAHAERPLFFGLHFQRRPAPRRNFVEETLHVLDAVILDGNKLIVREQPSVEELLFHLPSDPDEARDRSAEDPEQVARLKALLALVGEGEAGDEEELDAETLERLRALGYVK